MPTKSFESAGGAVIDVGGDEGLGDVLAVGADVLYWGGGGVAGDFTESLDTGKAALAGVGDDVVPVFATHYLNLATRHSFNAPHTVNEDDAVETVVVTDDVSTVAEDEYREVLLSGEIVGLGDFGGLLDLDDVLGGTAEAHGSEAGN